VLFKIEGQGRIKLFPAHKRQGFSTQYFTAYPQSFIMLREEINKCKSKIFVEGNRESCCLGVRKMETIFPGINILAEIKFK
jgi:hypothetical protein